MDPNTQTYNPNTYTPLPTFYLSIDGQFLLDIALYPEAEVSVSLM